MNTKEILNFSIISTGGFQLTVYHVLIIILVLIITKTIVWGLKKVLLHQAIKKKFDSARAHTIYQLIKYFLWVMAIILSLDTIGLNITILLAGSAALLVGLGLGLQSIFQDFVAGISILFEGTLKVNDVVEIEGGIVGRVREIGLRISLIETRDNIMMIIPNSKFINDNVINWSHHEKKTRFFVGVGVAYGSNVELVSALLAEAAAEHPKVVKKPEPVVKFTDFGESSLDFQVLFWTAYTFEVEMIKSDIRYTIDKKFRQNNITIPFPQRDVHMIKK